MYDWFYRNRKKKTGNLKWETSLICFPVTKDKWPTNILTKYVKKHCIGLQGVIWIENDRQKYLGEI